MRPINAAILLITLTASAHAVEQNVGASPDNALAVPIPPAVTSTIVPTDTAPIEAPPLPRPKPSVTGDNPAAPISAFRRQHGKRDHLPSRSPHPHRAGASERHGGT